MKITFCWLLLLVVILTLMHPSQAYPPYNGQPGCKTEEEIKAQNYRHFHNKTLYWRCTVIGQPATLERCPKAFGFLEPERKCIHFRYWYWTPPVQMPPSQPDNNGQQVDGAIYGPYYKGPYGPYYKGPFGPYRSYRPYHD